MPEVTFAHGRYTYVHHDQKEPFQAIDVHDILIQKSSTRSFLLFCLIVLLLLVDICFALVARGTLGISLSWSIILGSFVKSRYWKAIKKESVVIMPAFGVQLETHYRSGRIVRRFVPIEKILKPVLNECVTPLTCYWSLALIVRGEANLMLVFQELHPPLKMLVPFWKALCAATDDMQSTDAKFDG